MPDNFTLIAMAALRAECDALKAERDETRQARQVVAALLAQAVKSRDALRTALEGAADGLEQAADCASDIPDTYPDNAQIVTSCGHFRRVAEVRAAIRKALTP